ncbi:adenylate/guanylate cyclase domain-containing protein [Frankia sp. CNm7]|uniref:Adenylate/guanylate cyclase domain-containing protein n=1 Tax=Frankia nepalensis TaxID=1836974 RepID=A0A937URE4_9ACTN|nr:adenylate/guanylate cyclase domain-containing protein [Frankia nepalensis]MBL7500311.1 adenylate/guanylate cyclase domain-containing protein [Frankia nepalensis]MBL7508533.1 adenylate/guanylate cyclase domain-containing protein [Frankia nepalensis]MBL7520426.1 adenylate/guanylate cyclase domain-containing protein [Frankia nepalensis]MBL7627661.1 adenylate/guanylate cyclase domain-containing protein [Frankia nepalensis]
MVTQLREAFADPQSREARTLLYISQVESTSAKERQPEAGWLPALGWCYDTVTAIAMAADESAEIKYLGDAIMISFDSDHATDAVNVAIQVQEAINDAHQGRTGAKGTIDFSCSTGISTGSVVSFVTPTGSRDFVGTVVDKARGLCEAASPKAVFVDRATASAANVMRIRSRIGDALGRAPEQYQGDVQRAPLKGFDQPVEYYEILWDQQLYGFKSEAVTRSTDRMRTAAAPVAAGPTGGRVFGAQPGDRGHSAPEERHVGEVTCWRRESNFGFVRDKRTGEDFYFRSNHLVYPEDAGSSLNVGATVAFVASGTGDTARKRQAVAMLVVGDYAEGTLKLPDAKAHGWLRVQDGLGNGHHVFTPRRAVERYAPGTLLSFKVGTNDRGGLAEEIELPDEEDTAKAA